MLNAVGELSHLRSPVGFLAHVRLSTCSLETVVTNGELLSAELGNSFFLLGVDEVFQMSLGAFKLMLVSHVAFKSMN